MIRLKQLWPINEELTISRKEVKFHKLSRRISYVVDDAQFNPMKMLPLFG